MDPTIEAIDGLKDLMVKLELTPDTRRRILAQVEKIGSAIIREYDAKVREIIRKTLAEWS